MPDVTISLLYCMKFASTLANACGVLLADIGTHHYIWPMIKKMNLKISFASVDSWEVDIGQLYKVNALGECR